MSDHGTWDQWRITQWAVSTFGSPADTYHIIDRARKEFDEVCDSVLGPPHKTAEEIADVVIILSQWLEHNGFDLQDEIDKKMEINSVRSWVADGKGSGQHC